MTALTTSPPAPPGPSVSALRAHRTALVLAMLFGTAALLALAGLMFGPVRVPIADALRVLVGAEPADPRWQVIVATVRLPRVLTAIACGAALGVAGLQMQTLFRNSLADPYVLGVSSGASLGVALVVLVAGSAGAGFTAGVAGAGRAGVVLAAATGAAAVLGAVLVLSRFTRSPATLLLVGVMVGSAGTAAVSVLLVYADPQRVQQYLLWGLGSFAGTDWADIRLLLSVTAAGLVVAAVSVRELNALLLGETYARTMGIGVRRARLVTMTSASLLAGVTTAFCGPVAFIGLVVPHLSRIAVGTSDHRSVLPTVIVMGSAVALGCGFASQVPGSDIVLPLNAVTALFGAPIVVGVLLRSRRGPGL